MTEEYHEFYKIHEKINNWFVNEVRKKLDEFYSDGDKEKTLSFKNGSYIYLDKFNDCYYYWNNESYFDNKEELIACLDVECLYHILDNIKEIETNKEGWIKSNNQSTQG